MENNPENGNVLFLILIAVALFTGLMYAIAQTSTSANTQTVPDDKAEIETSNYIQYLTTLKQTIQRLQISKQCDETELSFENPIRSEYDYTSREECMLFHPNGGNLTWKKVNEEQLLDTSKAGNHGYGYVFINGNNEVYNQGTTCGAASCMELTAIIGYVKESICKKFNERLGVTTADTPPPQEGIIAMWVNEEFKGTFGNAGVNRVIGDEATELDGAIAGCLHQNTGTTSGYHFYYTLLSR